MMDHTHEKEPELNASIESLVKRIEDLITEIKETRKDVGAGLDATKELTKTVADLNAAWEKWRKAGKFGLSFMLTLSVASSMLIT